MQEFTPRPKAPFDALSPTILNLGARLVAEELTLGQYQDLYKQFVEACGWTAEEVAAEVDRRWSKPYMKAVEVKA
jgi:hypothetical protein